MNSYKELMDSIAILIDSAMENTTQIVFGVINNSSTSTCNITYAGIEYTLPYYGNTPVANRKYPILVPNGNMSQAFVLSNSSSGGSSGTSDHNQLINRSMSSQHPISAITNLQTTLDSKQSSITVSGENLIIG